MATIVSPKSLDGGKIQRLATDLDRCSGAPRLVGPDDEAIELPVELYEMLVDVVSELRRGYAVTILPLATVLTTAQAAELLNVSRPHVIKLIDDGEVPHHMVGSHRRIALADLLTYKERRDQTRDEALRKMHAVADEAGMDL